MRVPFSTSDFFDVFAAYNEAVFPVQVLLYLLAFAVLWAAIRRKKAFGRWIYGGLGLMWLWCGVAYHGMFFSEINRGAYLFGGLFVFQGLLFLFTGWRRPSVSMPRSKTQRWIAWSLVAYALILYPLFGRLTGHHYPATPTFGLPCPLTIFTFGILLLSRDQPLRRLLIIPTIWAVIGTSAVVAFGVYQDIMLIISAALSWWLVWRNKPL